MNRIIRHLPQPPHPGSGSNRANPQEPRPEDPIVRQYRFLLRTAPVDALEAAHVEALRSLEPTDRFMVLETVQKVLVAGLRLGPGDLGKLSHLIVTGERRAPGALLTSCPHVVLNRLADLVIHSEAAFGLFAGYSSWDGAEPQAEPSTDDSPFAEQWHEGQDVPAVYRGLGGSAANPESFLGY